MNDFHFVLHDGSYGWQTVNNSFSHCSKAGKGNLRCSHYSCDEIIFHNFIHTTIKSQEHKRRGGELEMTNMKIALWKIYGLFLISQHHKFLGFKLGFDDALMELFSC